MSGLELAERKCVVLGAGVSGRAAARFLLDRGAVVALYDDAPRAGLAAEVGSIEAAGARILEPGCCLGRDVWDLAVVSPGVPADAPLMRALEDTGTEVIGELELASRFLDAPIVAITGTNGKTTVTELLGRVLGARGSRVFVGGNLGTPLVEAIGRRWDFLVVEVSSFQLETVRTFRPRVAVLLNLTDDHLDRHKDLGAYARVKARIFENQGPGDAAVVNADDPVALDAARGARSTLLSYSTETTLPVGAWVEGGGVVFRLPDGAPRRAAGIELCLPGRFNLGNALAACLAASWVGVDPISAWAEARGFCGRPHRMQMFHEWRGIRFVDDSKATNVGAALAALETVPVPVVWVAGGSKKGGDYGPLAPRLRERARQVILVGAAAREMADACAGAAPLRVASDWPAAVRLAVEVAQPGDTVLLSPACASFDFFTNYAERGDVFQRLCRDETERIDRQAD